jgi:hypothetical protein
VTAVPYYVVNEGTPNRIPAYWTTATHIMSQPDGMWARALESPGVRLGVYPGTLCGLTAVHTVRKVRPAGVSCQECKSRWQLAVEAEAAKAALTPRPDSSDRRLKFIVIGVVMTVIAVVIGLIGAIGLASLQH